ncbi:MAG: GNAT family N-acetyltransferase [Anaerolineae bacterium]|nr:GNAT family N-acetyltransferase [Anaerolineae bacterium]
MTTVRFRILPAARLSAPERSAVLGLCSAAYEVDFAPLMEAFHEPVHLLAYDSGVLVSHALWVTRWLQPGGLPPLRTAFVEAVATAPMRQGEGIGTALMREVNHAIATYDLGGLCPAQPGLYERAGWEHWQGPLSIRLPAGGLLPTPQEQIMILRLPATPLLDPRWPLSAEWRVGELW